MPVIRGARPCCVVLPSNPLARLIVQITALTVARVSESVLASHWVMYEPCLTANLTGPMRDLDYSLALRPRNLAIPFSVRGVNWLRHAHERNIPSIMSWSHLSCPPHQALQQAPTTAG